MKSLSILRTKYDNIPLPVKASLWFVFCSVIQKAISFVTTPIFTRMMSVSEYGQVTMFNSWNEVFTIIATLDIFYGVYNNVLIKYKDKRNEATSSLLTLTSLLTTCVFAFYLIFKETINELTGMNTLTTVLLFSEILVDSAFRFWAAKERFDYKYKRIVVVTLVIAVINPLFGIISVYISLHKGYARIISLVLTQVIACSPIFFSILINGKTYYNREYWKYALSFNIPLLPHYLSAVVLNQSDRIMIDKMCGTDKAGIYGLCYTIAMVVLIVNQAIMNSYTPFTYKKLESGDYEGLCRYTRYLIVFEASFPIMFTCFAPEFLQLMGGGKYQDGIWLMAPLTASVFFRFLYSLYGNVEFYYEENKFIMVASTLGAALNIVLNYACILKWGYIAAGYTTLACFIFYSISHCIFAGIVQKKHIGKKKAYDNSFMLIISFVVICVCLGIMLTFDKPAVRYAIVFVLLASCIGYRKRIIRTVQVIRHK